MAALLHIVMGLGVLTFNSCRRLVSQMTSHVAEARTLYFASTEDLETTVCFFAFLGDKGITHEDGKSCYRSLCASALSLVRVRVTTQIQARRPYPERISRQYFLWEMQMPSFVLITSILRKYLSSPGSLIMKLFFKNSLTLLTSSKLFPS
ncbi:hypothetical protein Tco_0527373 [Tanacetum coccineum]